MSNGRVLLVVVLALGAWGCWGSTELLATGSPGPQGADPGKEPGRVVAEPLHRLNRLEYNNTVRDLLSTPLRPADAFPPDPSVGGFDNVADVLNLPPSLFALYADAARALADDALRIRPRYTEKLEAQLLGIKGQAGSAFENWGWSMDAVFNATLTVPQDEQVTINLLVGGAHSAKPPAPQLTLLVDGAALRTWTVTAPPSAPVVVSASVALTKGAHAVRLSFDNRYNQPAENEGNQLVVGYIQAVSAALSTPPGRQRLYTCMPAEAPDAAACYTEILTGFAARAWRRPLSAEEAAGLAQLWSKLAATEPQEEALILCVRAVLLSSKFLYRASYDAPAGAATPTPEWVPLDDHALASRLSYFLWSSMPDEALFEAARSGALRTDDGLHAAVTRMLADERSAGLRQGFASVWLWARALRTAAPDETAFPDFDEPLRQAMISETELFFGDFLHNGQPVQRMLKPDFTFANDRLAKHYGLPLPGSADPVRVTLPPGARGGLLMQGAWLTATSDPTHTSPVRRGRFILEQLLGQIIPAPPPGIPALSTSNPNLTMRERLAEHRANEKCALCHDVVDPVGLGMEEFDGVGARRQMEQGKPVDTSGALGKDKPFFGADQLAGLIQEDPRFTSTLVRNLYAYALGRGLVPEDESFLAELKDSFVSRGERLDALVELIVLSPSFRMRPATQGPEGTP